MPEIEIMLKGMSYRMTNDMIRKVNSLCPLRVELRREPENVVDSNAIAVYCDEEPWDGVQFGYVSREAAAELARKMDRGKISFVEDKCYLLDADDADGEGSLKLKFRKV